MLIGNTAICARAHVSFMNNMILLPEKSQTNVWVFICTLTYVKSLCSCLKANCELLNMLNYDLCTHISEAFVKNDLVSLLGIWESRYSRTYKVGVS